MSRWNYLLRKCFPKQSRLKNAIKLTGLLSASVGVSTIAAGESTNKFNQNIMDNVHGVLRYIRTLKTGVWISADYFFSMMGLDESSPNYAAMMHRIHQRSADTILYCCLQNGGTYVKMGQGLVSLGHILPKEYTQTLKRLQDQCLTRGKDEIYQIFEEDFGKRPEEIFSSFDMEPVAAASIAHVYRAKTKDNQDVAVKIQYKDLQKRLNSDIFTISLLYSIASFVHPDFDFSWIFDHMKVVLKKELDFINEGRNSERCAMDLKKFKYIHVPKVFWDLTSTRVLVTEFVEGHKISDVEALKKDKFSLSDIDYKLFEAFGHQVFQTGFVHADPHPGNVLVRRRNGSTELVILDHGLYQEVSENDRLALSHLWKAIVLRDHVNMEKYSNILGVKNYEVFAEILTQSPLRFTGFKIKVHLTQEDLNHMQEAARKKFDKIMLCLRSMPRPLLLVIRNLNTLRAIAYEHGNPIDRYAILARMATKASFNVSNEQNSLIRRALNVLVRIYFEIFLYLNKVFMCLKILILGIISRTKNMESFMMEMRKYQQTNI